MGDKPIRILQVIPDMRSGGAENFIMNLYRNMDRSKIQFDFVVHYQERRFFDDEIEKNGGNIYRFSLRDDNNVTKYMMDLNRFYKSHREYKVVHCHWNSMGFIHFLVAKHNGVKVRIGHSHNSSAGIGIKGKIKRLLMFPYKKVTTHRLACSDASGRFLWGKKDYLFIPNAIDVDRFKFNVSSRKAIRNQYNLNDNDILIGHVGRFSLQKNHEQLIEIFKEISLKNYYLILIGEGELFEQIQKKVTDYNLKERVLFAGVQADMGAYYSAMDVFVLPSLYEGLPLTAVEAQANGLPSLLSDTITPQVKINDNVFYINNKKITDWCNTIIENSLISSDRALLNDAVKNSHFNIVELSSYFSKLYTDLYNSY